MLEAWTGSEVFKDWDSHVGGWHEEMPPKNMFSCIGTLVESEKTIQAANKDNPSGQPFEIGN